MELEKEGLELDGVEVYETAPNPNIETDFANVTSQFQSIPEYIVFFSPSGFNSSIELIRRAATDLNNLKVSKEKTQFFMKLVNREIIK